MRVLPGTRGQQTLRTVWFLWKSAVEVSPVCLQSSSSGTQGSQPHGPGPGQREPRPSPDWFFPTALQLPWRGGDGPLVFPFNFRCRQVTWFLMSVTLDETPGHMETNNQSHPIQRLQLTSLNLSGLREEPENRRHRNTWIEPG